MGRQRGFTMMELMVSLGIGAVASVGIFALLRTQMLGYSQQGGVGESQYSARAAIDIVSRRVRNAGLGLPGLYSFGVIDSNSATPGPEQVCPNTDVLEVRARSPYGRWRLAVPGASSTTLALRALDPPAAKDPPWKTGTRVFVYAGLGATGLARTIAPRASGAMMINLAAADSAALDDTRVAKDNAEVYTVETSRFFLSCADPEHPVLLLQEGVDENGDNLVDVQDTSPIAAEIEDFQVAYLLDADADGLVSDTDAVHEPATDDEKMRIRAVRITVVARSPGPINGVVGQAYTIEDHTPAVVADKFARRLLREVIVLDNRDTREGRYDSYFHISSEWL